MNEEQHKIYRVKMESFKSFVCNAHCHRALCFPLALTRACMSVCIVHVALNSYSQPLTSVLSLQSLPLLSLTALLCFFRLPHFLLLHILWLVSSRC